MNAIANSAVARELNSFLVRKGGQAIPGLETLDPQKLQKLQKGMQEFLDLYDDAGSDLGALVGQNAIESMREMSKLLSQKGVGAPAQGALRLGMCGGAPAAPPPLAVVSPERQAPVSPERGAGSGNNVTVGALAAPVSGRAGPLGMGGASPLPTGNNATFNPLAASFVSGSSLVSNLRSSPTAGFNALAALNQAAGLGSANAANLTALGSFGALAASTVSGVDPNLEALQGAGGGGGFFEDKLFELMIKIVGDMQKQIEDRLKKLQEQADAAAKEGGKKGGKGGFLGGVVKGVIGIAAPIVGAAIGGPVGGMIGSAVGKAVSGSGGAGGAGGGGAAGAGGQESRNIEFEKIKFDMQKLSQMQQALSNILNTMDELAKNAIRNIKGG